SLGAFIGNRLMRRIAPIPLLNAGSTIAILGAALLFAAAVTGALSVATVLVPMLVVTVGFGIASALALTGALSAAPKAIGAASGLYGFMQMAVGAICTMLVGIWPADHAVAASSVMLIAMLLGRGALTVATRRGFGTGGWLLYRLHGPMTCGGGRDTLTFSTGSRRIQERPNASCPRPF